MKLLIADDDANTINLIGKYLTAWNYDVVIVNNGLEAIRVMASENPPEILILDWMMPGMDGVEVIKKVRQMKLSPPPYVMLFTVRDEKGAIIEGLDAGANDYITKPFDQEEFHARIRVDGRSVYIAHQRYEDFACNPLSVFSDVFAHKSLKRLTGFIDLSVGFFGFSGHGFIHVLPEVYADHFLS